MSRAAASICSRRDSGPHRLDRRLLRALQHRVAPRDLGVGLADAVRTGGVGVVTGFVGAADVDDDDVAGAQFTVGALVVRVGAMRPGADDDECDLRMSFGDNGLRDVGGHVGLGTAGHQELRHARVDAVDRRAGLAQ